MEVKRVPLVHTAARRVNLGGVPERVSALTERLTSTCRAYRKEEPES